VEELNKNPCYFLSYFKEFGEQKNYQFSSKVEEVVSKKAKKENALVKMLVDAPTITEGDYEGLIKDQKKNKALEYEKYLIEKYLLMKRLGVDNLDEDIITQYHGKESTINNFLYLVDINNFKPIDTTECTQKLNQLHKVKELINDLGFKIFMMIIRSYLMILILILN
jgi:hypothetical protein